MTFEKAAPPAPQERWGARGNVSIADRTVPTANSNSHRKQAGGIVGRDRLSWNTSADGGLSLHYRRHQHALVYVVPEVTRAGMFRVRFADGLVSDMANLSRAKDAAIAAALRDLNSEVQETAPGRSPVRQSRRAGT